YSLGLGCADLSLRGIFQYKLHAGPYLRGQAGYHLRGNAKIERDYYYTTHGVYSNEVNMPNAVSYGVTLGSWLFDDGLKIEAMYDGMNTLGGFDIRRQDAGFPANKMIFSRVGAGFQFFPGKSGLGVLGSAHQVLTGRNVGKSTSFTAGLTYQFGLWNQQETELINN
nr:transporter [Bacteroidota bacterium]